MKTNTFLKNILCITGLLICLPAWSLTDEDIVQSLEALGEWKIAYPLAYQLAQQQNTYAAWRKVTTQYAHFDTKGWAYLQTWQQAHKANQEAIYKDFLTLKSETALNRHAIHAIFQITKGSNNIADYLQFMETYPDTVESVDALLQIHQIAFDRAQKKHDPLIYDVFVTTFQGAQQIPKAIQLAFEAEKQAIVEKDNDTTYEQHERLARRLYNEARLAEKAQNLLVAARKYLLLDLDRFRDTRVLTELLDRQERHLHHKLMQTQLLEIDQSINEMREAIVETIQVQEQAIVKELREQGQRLENVIATHNRLLAEQLKQINRKTSGDTPIEKMLESIPTVGKGLKIAFKTAKFMAKILPKMRKFMKSPNKQQAFLLDR
ncbi:hypothetical protein PN36_24910 [Candidatus Thiomargarita nelsonii]|uniref:Secreted protein n=1 Tax=Candidatus Thiomargarita nelsonii TaxID=1003181 RepID=A0A0A6P824_9GAMM|nr:hypothetical protein PN36_24910 [Candidatus Thiomargarita nelsonii]